MQKVLQDFIPGGVTERTFKVPLSQGRKVGTDFYVMLNNEDGNVDSKSATAKVKFVDNTANNSNDENGISLYQVVIQV